MAVGVPREIKDNETRVGCVPSMVLALVERGHQVLVETQAGIGGSLADDEYNEKGSVVVDVAIDQGGATVPYLLLLADRGLEEACKRSKPLSEGVNTYKGAITYAAVAESQRKQWQSFAAVA